VSISRLFARLVSGSECGAVRASVGAYVDGQLDDETRARVERHVAGCHRCRREGEEFRRLAALLEDSLAAPARGPDELRQALTSAREHLTAIRLPGSRARASWLALPESALPILGAALLVLLALGEAFSVSGLEEDALTVASYLGLI